MQWGGEDPSEASESAERTSRATMNGVSLALVRCTVGGLEGLVLKNNPRSLRYQVQPYQISCISKEQYSVTEDTIMSLLHILARTMKEAEIRLDRQENRSTSNDVIA